MTRNQSTFIGLAIVATVSFLALFGPVIAPNSTEELIGDSYLAPSRDFLLGTNLAGQDLFSVLLAGARTSFMVALPVAAMTVLVAFVVGGAGGWLGGAVDRTVRSTTNFALVIPRLPLLIVLGVYVDRSILSIALIITAVSWAGPARVLRAKILGLRNRADLRAARGFGASGWHLVRRHVVREIAPLIAVALIEMTGRAIVLEAGLAFLGIGDPARISWGATMRDALLYSNLFLTNGWAWWLLPPVAAVSITMVGLTLVGTSLDEWANSRLKTRAQ